MIKRVTFVFRSKAENTIGISDCAVISITEPISFLRLAELKDVLYEVLRAEFDDVDPETFSDKTNKFMSIHPGTSHCIICRHCCTKRQFNFGALQSWC